MERTFELAILDRGRCEPLKATVHGTALGLAAVMALYNGAAWLRRREPHLAINMLLYAAAVAWETAHLRHHLAACHRAEPADAEGEAAATARRVA